MKNDKRLLQVLIAINSISNDKSLNLSRKLQHILLEVIWCMRAKSGSIMLVKGTKNLEVVASTNDELIGVRQHLNEESPSTWVVKYKAPLYVEDISRSDIFTRRFDHYQGEAFLLMPVIGIEKVIGVLSVTDKIGDDLFSEEGQKVLLNVTGQIISALENQRLAESLKRKKRALQKKNLQLKKLEKLKMDLCSMLLHDIKGPISELMANLDILSCALSEENRKYVESAKTGCETLHRTVSNFLDIARLEKGKLKPIHEDPQKNNPEPLDPEPVNAYGQICP